MTISSHVLCSVSLPPQSLNPLHHCCKSVFSVAYSVSNRAGTLWKEFPPSPPQKLFNDFWNLVIKPKFQKWLRVLREFRKNTFRELTQLFTEYTTISPDLPSVTMYSHKWCSRGRELPGVLIDVCRWHKRIDAVNPTALARQKIGEGKGDTKGETVREEKSVYRRRKAGLPCLPLGFPLRRESKLCINNNW